MGIVKALGGLLARLGKVALWPVTKIRSLPAATRRMRWVLHLLMVALATACLGYLNWSLELEKALRVPWPALRHVWLPLLFLLAYTMAWLGWWFWKLLATAGEPSPFPDLDAAWEEATEKLSRAGIELDSRPLFLLLGGAAGAEPGLLSAAQFALAAGPAPRQGHAPLRMWATQEAIYVTCPEASLLARQAELYARARADEGPFSALGRSAGRDAAGAATTDSPLGGAPQSGETVELAAHQGWTWSDADPSGEGAGAATLPTIEQSLALAVADEPDSQHLASGWPDHVSDLATRRTEYLKDPAEIAERTARLTHVCTLIARDRRPYCPINGLLVMIPAAATAGDHDAQQLALLAQRELRIVRDTLEVQCPVLTMVCDLEQLPGGEELLDRFPAAQRHRRLGVELPLLPADDAPAAARQVEEALSWLCQSLLPSLVYRLLRLDPAQPDDVETSHGNERLYELLDELRLRQKRIVRILAHGVLGDGPGTWLLGGCFLAATGNQPAQQGFVAGVFPQLTEMQSMLSWRPEALATDARLRLWTRLGYAAIAASTLLLVAALVWL